jgi:replicative DNA helicase
VTVPDDHDDQSFGRVPPQDLDAEQSVLGGMMLSKDAIGDVLPILGGRDFYRPSHETIYAAILALYGQGEPADPITVAAELTRRGEISKVGGASYLHALVQTVPTAANAEYYAEIVRDMAILRRLAEAGTRVVQLAHDGTGDVADIADRAQAEIYAATDDRDQEEAVGGFKLMELTVDGLETASGNQGDITGVPTGFADLDILTRGLQPGQLVLIAARPSIGKSTLALDMLRACSIKHDLPAVFFSLEMSRDEIGMRMLSAEARVGLHHMRAGTLQEEDWRRISLKVPGIQQAPFCIEDKPGHTLMSIRAACRKLKQRHGLELVIVDYIQLMETGTGGSRRPENRQQEVSQISRSLKLLAKELNVPVVALSQLNRGPEQRAEKEPMLSDLRESGALEQDADVVILLNRPDFYDKESERAGEADLIVAKHRNGPTATVTVAFQGHYSRFVDMASVDTAPTIRTRLKRTEPERKPLASVHPIRRPGTPPAPLTAPQTVTQAPVEPPAPADAPEPLTAPQTATQAPVEPPTAAAPEDTPAAATVTAVPPRAPFAVLEANGHLIYPDGTRTPGQALDLAQVRHLGQLADINATFNIRDLYVPARTAAALGLPEDIGATEWNEGAAHPTVEAAIAGGWDVKPAGLHKRLNVYRADTHGHGGALVFPAWDPNIDHGQTADAITIARAVSLIRDHIGVPYASSPTATMRRLVGLTERDKVRTPALQPIRIPDVERAFPDLYAPHLSAGLDLDGRWLHMFDVNKAFASAAALDLAVGDYRHHTAPELPKYLLPGDYRIRTDLTHLGTPAGQRPTLGRTHLVKGSRTTIEAWVRSPLVTELRERGASFEVTEAWIADDKRRILADPMKRITDAIDALKATSTAKGDAESIAAGILKGAYAAWVNGDIQSDYRGERAIETDAWYRPDISADVKSSMLFRKGRLLLKASQEQPIHVIADETDAVILLSDNPDPMTAFPGLEIDPVKNGKFKHVASAPVTDAIAKILKDPKARASLRARKTKEAVKAYGKGE